MENAGPTASGMAFEASQDIDRLREQFESLGRIVAILVEETGLTERYLIYPHQIQYLGVGSSVTDREGARWVRGGPWGLWNTDTPRADGGFDDFELVRFQGPLKLQEGM